MTRKQMALGTEVTPGFTEATEELRCQALYSDTLDNKTSQLMVYCFLISRASAGACWHAKAARRYGISWEELHMVMEIA